MSAETIARWNSIPLVRPEEPSLADQEANLKRARDDDGDGDDDDISIASRTPSPEPMDVDVQDIDKYDEYARGIAREVITVDTKISSSNKGFSMLAKLGWVEGQPLGVSGDGRVDPIPFYIKRDLTGLGKSSQDARVIESTVSQRRELDSERQRKETEDQRLARENSVARQAIIQSELSETLKAFYCSVCEKQFTKVAQYDEHCNSYSHHHKIRFRDMQAAQRAKNNSQEAIDKRKEKERKREEKELRKVAKAAGVKIAATGSVSLPMTPAAPVTTPAPPTDGGANEIQLGHKTKGWTSVVSEASTSASAGGFKKSGWSTVDSSASSAPPPPQEVPPPPPPSSSSASSTSLASFSGFRSGGWTSLESSSSHSGLQQTEAVTPDPASVSRGGWVSMNPTPLTGTGEGWPAAAATSSAGSRDGLPSLATPLTRESSTSSSHGAPVSAPRAEAARSGWQNFKRGGTKSKR